MKNKRALIMYTARHVGERSHGRKLRICSHNILFVCFLFSLLIVYFDSQTKTVARLYIYKKHYKCFGLVITVSPLSLMSTRMVLQKCRITPRSVQFWFSLCDINAPTMHCLQAVH